MNNPLSLVDPSGLEAVGQQWGGLPSGGSCDESTGYCIKKKTGAPRISDAGIFFVGSANRLTEQLRTAGAAVGRLWLRATAPIDRAAAGSTALQYAIRARTGVPMSIAAKFFKGTEYAALAYTGYSALKAMHDEYQACMSY